jgi:glycosyltransferase involved in cell wall biosynthesis
MPPGGFNGSLKIARVVHTLYPETQGDFFGTHELSEKQVLDGNSVRLYTWSMGEKPSISSENSDLVIVRLGGPNLAIPFLFKDYPLLPSLGGEIEKGGADVLHAHSHLFITSLQAGLAARKTEVPFVVTVHGVLARRGFPTDALQMAYLRTLGSRIFGLAQRVICVSKGDADEVTALGCPRGKIRVVPNAVDSGFFRPGSGARREDEVLWVGRFVPEKGLDVLLRAMKIVLDHRKATLRLVGDGPGMSRIQDIAKGLGIRRDILFEGRVGKKEVARFMSEASIFALPSVKEGLPKVLLQAMASELAVVASEIPGVVDVVFNGKNGLLFKQGDAQDLARCVLGLLSNPQEMRRLGREGRDAVVRNYSWEKTLRGLDEVYKEAREIFEVHRPYA